MERPLLQVEDLSVTFHTEEGVVRAANGISYEVDEGAALNVPAAGVLGNDSDPDGDDLTAVLVTGPSEPFVFALTPGGSFTYDQPDDNGPDAFTYKASDGKIYKLNFIDTPGHVDFSYEVSGSLAACEGAVLVVDAAQGVEAQSVANCYTAVELGLEVIPVLNKIDLPSAEPERVKQEIEDIIGCAVYAIVASGN